MLVPGCLARASQAAEGLARGGNGPLRRKRWSGDALLGLLSRQLEPKRRQRRDHGDRPERDRDDPALVLLAEPRLPDDPRPDDDEEGDRPQAGDDDRREVCRLLERPAEGNRRQRGDADDAERRGKDELDAHDAILPPWTRRTTPPAPTTWSSSSATGSASTRTTSS